MSINYFIQDDYMVLQNIPIESTLEQLNNQFIYYKGEFNSQKFVVIGSAIRQGIYVLFPIKRINLLLPPNPEPTQKLPYKGIQDYVKPDLSPIGKGLYGKVFRSGNFAIKTFFGDSTVNTPYLDYSFLREVSVLKRLSHPHIVKLIDIVTGDPEKINLNAVSIVLELADYNLETFLRKYGNQNRRYITHQILQGFNYLQSKDIVHGDIKPDNVLIFTTDPLGNPLGSLICKITDFGFSIPTSCHPKEIKTSAYNVYFRAPEVLFGLGFGLAADIWAIGCLIYYIYSLDYLFYEANDANVIPNENLRGELVAQHIFETLGSPKGNWDELYDYITKKGFNFNFGNKSLEIMSKVGNTDMFNIIYGMLQYNPHNRTPISDALKNRVFDIFNQSGILSHDTCYSIVDNRQKYTKDIYLSKNRELVSKRLYDFLITTKAIMNKNDYFYIMYLYDRVDNNFQNTIQDKLNLLMACIDICTFYRYAVSSIRNKQLNIFNLGTTSPVEWNRINELVKMIINIIDYDLIVSTIQDYLDVPNLEIFETCVSAVVKGLPSKYMAKDLTNSIVMYESSTTFFDIITDLKG